ncbi:tetratricopeptide repeat protein [bacterium]|nr:tetratricopeptide repeat protein [bacterium]
MEKRYIAILTITLVCLLFLNLFIMVSNPVWQKKKGNDLMRFGMMLSKNKVYVWSNWALAASKKLNPKLTWIDFNIAHNKFMDARDNNYSKRYKNKLYNEAIILYNRELDIHPDDTATLVNVGFVYYELEDFEKAVRYFNRVLELNPKDSYSLYKMAYINTYEYENYSKALDYINRYIEVKPKAADGYFAKGFILAEMERNREAIAAYKKYLEFYPDSVAALVNISSLEIDVKDWKNAEIHTERGLKFNSTSSYLLSNKIDILIHKKQYAEAEEIADKILNKCCDTGYIAYWEKAKIEKAKHNSAKAEEYFNKSKANAKDYYDKHCDKKRYDLHDSDGNCRNRYNHIKNFEKNKQNIQF